MTRNWLKVAKALQDKKTRKEEGLFLVEGAKSVEELCMSGWQIVGLLYTSSFETKLKQLGLPAQCELQLCSEDQLSKAGALQSNNAATAIVKMPVAKEFSLENEYVLLLDAINDPGNLGSIVRIADWYSIKKIVCSKDSVDLFNPKTISASKGSFTRIEVYYSDLASLLQKYPKSPCYGMYLNGRNLHESSFPKTGGFLLFGNEANGVRPELEPFISQKLTIPRFGEAESLNVAMSVAIICDNLVQKIEKT